MAEPFLDLGDIRLVRERIGSGCCAQRMHPEAFYFGADAGLESVFLYDVAINEGQIERPVEGICRAPSCIRNAQALTGPNCTHPHAFNLRATEYFGYNFSLSAETRDLRRELEDYH